MYATYTEQAGSIGLCSARAQSAVHQEDQEECKGHSDTGTFATQHYSVNRVHWVVWCFHSDTGIFTTTRTLQC